MQSIHKKIALILFTITILVLCSKTIAPASVPLAHAQTCSVPSQVQNVSITFPSCTGDVCNFTQGSCAWNSVTGATQYQVTVTEVETGTTILTQQFDGSVTSTNFSVHESNTYKCDVAAINSCGTGPTGTASLLCKVDAAVTSTPTTATNNTPLVPKTLPVTGSTDNVVFIMIGSIACIIAGITLAII